MSGKALVLALVTGAFGGRGGVAAVSRDVARSLARLDDVGEIEIHPVLDAEDSESTPAKVRQRPGGSSRPGYVLSALRTARARRPRLVYCDHLHLAPPAALAARLAGAPLLVHVHGYEIWSEPSPLRRRALESADLLLCVSRDTRRRVLSFLDLPPERVAVLNNTFDVEPIAESGEDAAPAQWVPEASSMLLTVGRLNALEQYKGHDHVFKALAVLRARGVDVSYVVAGDGDDRARLEALAKDRGVANHVRFLGQVPRAELLRLYRAASVFVMPSSGEGFGIAFVEAMAMGTPAVGLGVGGATDALADPEVAIMTTPDELPAAIERALALPAAARTAGAARIRARFGRERFDAAFAGLWRRLITPGAIGESTPLRSSAG